MLRHIRVISPRLLQSFGGRKALGLDRFDLKGGIELQDRGVEIFQV
jgi:hypothetical protein